MTESSYKLRSRKLKELGYKNYLAYLTGPHWQQRRAEFEAAHARQCNYCDEFGEHLHHKRYKNLGAEQDNDLEWVCSTHHSEIVRFGSIQPATDRQRAILRDHHYGEEFVVTVTFGTAYDLIGRLSRGEEESPRDRGL